MSQPSLSHAIAQLEKELGIPLFEKNGRNTTLTRFGEEFLSCAEHTLSTLDEGITTLHRNARGEGLIRIGMLRPLGIEYILVWSAGFLKRSGPGLRTSQFTLSSRCHTVSSGWSGRTKICSQSAAQPYYLENTNLQRFRSQKQDLVMITPQSRPLQHR
ncbi:MAG: LysR family transcriptional regulator [Mediterraneibacter gnavus]